MTEGLLQIYAARSATLPTTLGGKLCLFVLVIKVMLLCFFHLCGENKIILFISDPRADQQPIDQKTKILAKKNQHT